MLLEINQHYTMQEVTAILKIAKGSIENYFFIKENNLKIWSQIKRNWLVNILRFENLLIFKQIDVSTGIGTVHLVGVLIWVPSRENVSELNSPHEVDML